MWEDKFENFKIHEDCHELYNMIIEDYEYDKEFGNLLHMLVATLTDDYFIPYHKRSITGSHIITFTRQSISEIKVKYEFEKL